MQKFKNVSTLPRTSYLLRTSYVVQVCPLGTQHKYDSIALFGKENFVFLKQFLELKKGIPSHDTINRVFQMLNPRQFELCFISWAKGLKEAGIMKDVIAMVSEPVELLTEKPFVGLKTVFIINLPCTLYMRGALKMAFVWGKWNVEKKPTK